MAESDDRNTLVVFLGLAFALSWWVWPLYVLDLSLTPFFAYEPLVAAFVAIGMTEGWSGYRSLGARMIHWRVRWRWWIVALGMPLGEKLGWRGYALPQLQTRRPHLLGDPCPRGLS